MNRVCIFTTALGVLLWGCFNPTYPEGIGCGYEGSCPEGFTCDPVDNRCRLEVRDPACSDSFRNGDETDIDCGGSCAPCADGLACAEARDCESQVCEQDACAVPMCGDGVANSADEDCDTGGESAECNADCSSATCGDGQVNSSASEECDDSGESADCDSDCTAAMCGDGTLNMTRGESCDDGADSVACNADCSLAACGDSYLNSAAGEECDSGGDAVDCDGDCTAPACGDGYYNPAASEDCDTAGDSMTCDGDCTEVECGDGYHNAATEACDDSGESAVCDDDCTPVECGDGVTNMTAGEQCDDGNTNAGDGCAADCTAESGCSAMASFSVQMTPDIWLCAYNNENNKTWPETYGVCNEAAGYYLASVGPMTRRGAPDNASIAAAMAAAAANNHDFITTGQPARSCSWDSVATSYESCNGLGYLHTTGDASNTGPNWIDLTDGNEAEFRNWNSANSTGAHRLASMCMNASADPLAYVFDHRWR